VRLNTEASWSQANHLCSTLQCVLLVDVDGARHCMNNRQDRHSDYALGMFTALNGLVIRLRDSSAATQYPDRHVSLSNSPLSRAEPAHTVLAIVLKALWRFNLAYSVPKYSDHPSDETWSLICLVWQAPVEHCQHCCTDDLAWIPGSNSELCTRMQSIRQHMLKLVNFKTR
jgi:hypothetical protein